VQARFTDSALLWAMTGLVVVLSVVVHGITATPIMNRLDRRRNDGASGTGGDEPSVAA
jgi:NhaP-type Na+/H+ or K+/H+ antiporter